MRVNLTGFKVKNAALTALLSSALLGTGVASAAINPDFSNPAIAMTSDAVIASGACIAKYAAILDEPSKPAAEIGQRVAKRCAKEISRSAGLASWMIGKPEEYPKNLKFIQEDLTTSTVVRSRAAAKRQRTA
ncbi:MAG: hypothetical protein ACLPTF_06040 [Steroidobacteraceae bacterium]